MLFFVGLLFIFIIISFPSNSKTFWYLFDIKFVQIFWCRHLKSSKDKKCYFFVFD